MTLFMITLSAVVSFNSEQTNRYYADQIRTHRVNILFCPLGYKRVYLPLCKVADTPFHIQGNNLFMDVFSHTR